jgi:hypothetical protein
MIQFSNLADKLAHYMSPEAVDARKNKRDKYTGDFEKWVACF